MSVFRRFLAGIGYQARPVVFDNALGVPEVLAARDAAIAGDFGAWNRALTRCRTPSDREAGVWCVEDARVSSDAIAAWPRGAPEVGGAHLARAIRLIRDGWQIRTGYRAQHVTDVQFAAFHEHLGRAEEHLARAAELLPDDPAPWGALVVSGMGLGSDAGERDARYAGALARGGEAVYGLHGAYLQAVCAKWGGSHDAMFAFARAHLRPRAPSSGNALIVEAHLQRAIEADGAGWLARPEVREELVAAAAGAWAPGFPEDTAGLRAHNVFALVLGRAGLAADAARHVGHLRDRFHEYPWIYFPTARADAERAQRAAIADGWM